MRAALVAAGLVLLVAVVISGRRSQEREVSAALDAANTSYSPPPARIEPIEREGAWRVSRDSSEMDGSLAVYVSTTATGSITGWLKEHQPTLMIRCKENETDAYVVTGMAANPEYGTYQQATVRLRFDAAQPVSERWGEATDNEALFAPSPVALARKIAVADTVRFEFTPFNASPVVATFVTRNARDAIEEVAEACKWSLDG